MTSAALVPTAPADELKRLKTAFPLVQSRGGGVEELARAASVSTAAAQAAMDDPETALELLDAQSAAEDDGRLLKPVAARLTLAMLNKLGGELDAGALDADDIANLLPKVHKVVEHSDRMEEARRDNYDNLPVFHIHFINGAMVGRVEPLADVVDVDAAEVKE